MIRTHAWGLVAGMQNEQTSRDGSMRQFPSNAMSTSRVSRSVLEHPVSVAVRRAGPDPALAGLVDLLPEPLGDWAVVGVGGAYGLPHHRRAHLRDRVSRTRLASLAGGDLRSMFGRHCGAFAHFHSVAEVTAY